MATSAKMQELFTCVGCGTALFARLRPGLRSREAGGTVVCRALPLEARAE